MVYIIDEGIFDAPLDKIWRFMQDETSNAHQHRAVQFARLIEKTANEMVVETESKSPDGRLFRGTRRFVFNPPDSFSVEYLSGPQTGTKHTHTYTSMNDKTKVVVAGEFKIQGLDDEATRKVVLAWLEESFNEDNASLKNYK